MTDSVLDVLKFVFLGLLYLFFVRVLWVVGREVRESRAGVGVGGPIGGGMPNAGPTAGGPAPAPMYAEAAPLPVVGIPGPAPVPGPLATGVKPKRGKKGNLARLAIIEPRIRRGQVFPITHELTMGRAGGCTIQVLDDTFVSSVHCRIFRDEAGNAIVEDLGSTNGTYLNGDRIVVPKPLHQGDRIQIGGTIVEAQ